MARDWLRTQDRFRLVFVGVMVLLGSTLGWLTWELLERQEQTERETAAERVVVVLQTRLSEVEQDLTRLLLNGEAREPATGAVLIHFRADAIRAWPSGGLLYYPELPGSFEIPEFGAVERMELAGDYSGALAALRERLASDNPNRRASAMAGIARIHLFRSQFDEALGAFSQLSKLGPVLVDGLPAALAAQSGTLAVFERRGDAEAAARAAQQLDMDLQNGTWSISRSVYESLSNQAKPYLQVRASAVFPRLGLAEAVHALWEKWGGDPPAIGGPLTVNTSAGPILLVARASREELAVYAADADHLDRVWLSELKGSPLGAQVQLGLSDHGGNPILGTGASATGTPATRLARDTHLPWTIQVFNVDEDFSWNSRRALILASMIVLFALICAGSWFISHLVSRELAVARLQSDFVSAVSHEFRTPLTALLQVSELLKRGRVAEEDREEYYESLHDQSQRLHRLVESLLNFGRLESGKLQFRFEELDAAAFLRQSASEFAEEQRAQGYRFEVDTRAESPIIRADRETLRCVLWNLFENAVKYSPDCRTIWVNLTRRDSRVEIAVRDQGVGILPGEQRSVFEKFVRGSAARETGIRGTGIGLAMARQIVQAHGGDITLESEPGKGSTFKVSLPLKVA